MCFTPHVAQATSKDIVHLGLFVYTDARRIYRGITIYILTYNYIYIELTSTLHNYLVNSVQFMGLNLLFKEYN